MNSQLHQRLFKLIKSNALIYDGEFELASGLKTDHYYDMKSVTLDGEGSSLATQLLFAEMQKHDCASVGGLESGSIPIAAMLVNYAFNMKHNLTGFYVRKKPKPHGQRKLIEGIPRDPSIIVDDVTTTGDSVLKAVDALSDEDVRVLEVITIVDRGEEFRSQLKETIREKLEQKHIPFFSLFEDSDFTKHDNVSPTGSKVPLTSDGRLGKSEQSC
jgi:orotate phosphoribosyltransferase